MSEDLAGAMYTKREVLEDTSGSAVTERVVLSKMWRQPQGVVPALKKIKYRRKK